MDGEAEQLKQDPGFIEQVSYSEDQSPEFDKLLKSQESIDAPQDGLSKSTKDKLLTSSWFVPCHAIITKTENGDCQLFHIQPNKLSSSLLTFTQEKTLNDISKHDARAIVIKNERSWFGTADRNELDNLKINLEKVIDVNTSNWWRLVFNPQTNEVWIDIKDQKLLKKYHGFNPEKY